MQEFGRYQLIDRIGAGGMAEVYLARHLGAEGLEKLVVIKRIRPEHAQKPRFITMFIDEAKIAVSLNHPNIAQVYEFGRVERDFYLAMEYVEGSDLARLQAASHRVGLPMPVQDTIYIGIELSKALDYAHRKRDKFGQPLHIVHRDISPQNIIISRDGGVKLLDFGIAKAAHIQESQGELRGKYSYMSPEQARADAVDARSDQFALGAVLWELLVGRPLFPFTQSDQTLELVRAAQIPSLRQERPEIPALLEEILMQALAREPEQRFADARALQVALTRCLFQVGEIADSVTLASYLQQIEAALPRGAGLVRDASAAGSGTHVPEADHPPGPQRTFLTQGSDEALLDHFSANSDLQSQITESPELEQTGERAAPRLEGTFAAGRQTPGEVPVRFQNERKECVLVCGDLRGFNALRSLMGVERWRQVLMDYIRIVESIAFKNQALVDRVNESGFTLLLGLPISSENDAERALALAQDLVEAVEAINLNLDSPLQLSTGIMVGMAVLEYPEVAGTSLSRRSVEKFEWFYDQEAPGRGGLHLAEALARAALPREILIGGRVFRRVRAAYHTEPVATLEVDLGGEQPLMLSPHRVLSPKSSREQVRDVRHAYRKMFGRELPLKELRDLYRRTRLRSRTQGVMFIGEKGVGKSTLVQEFVAGLRSSQETTADIAVYRGVAELSDKDAPYGSLGTLLLEILGLGRGADLREARARVRALRENLLRDLPLREQRHIVHALAFVIGIKLNKENLLEALDPENRQAALFEHMCSFLSVLSHQRPILFAVEDMHNVDSGSLGFLAHYLNRRRSDPVFFILTSIPVDAPEGSPWSDLQSSRYLTLERLGELEPPAARALAEALLPEELAQQEAVDALVTRTGGNPLYIKELVELIAERDIQTPRELLGQLAATDEDACWIPTTVEGLIINRIDRLPTDARKTLQRCGLLGHTFGEEMVEQVLASFAEGGQVSGELDRLELLVREGFLVRLDRPGKPERGEETISRALRRRYQDQIQGDPLEAQPRGRQWAFANSVIMEVAARSLVEPELGELHRVLAQHMLSRGGDILKKDVVSIALHLDAAGDDARAGEMYLVAAYQALDSMGGDESLRLINKALERVDYSSEHYRSALELKERALGLLGRPQERQEVLDELLELLEQDGTARQVMEVQVRALRLLYERGELEEVEQRGLELLKEARLAQDRPLIGRVLRLLHMIYRDTGRHGMALRTIDESVDCFRAAGDAEGLWASLVSRGITQRQSGQLDQAQASYHEALQIVEAQGLRRQEQTTRTNLALLYVNQGAYDAAWTNYQLALESVRDLGYLRDEASLLVNLGHLQMKLGDYTRAHKSLVNGIRLARKTRDKLALCDGLISLGMVHLYRERHREAEALLDKGLRLAHELSNVYLMVHALSTQAEVCLDRGEGLPDQERALALALEVQEMGQRAGLLWVQAHAGSLKAEALAALGRAEEALDSSLAAVALLDQAQFDGAEHILARHVLVAQELDPVSASQARLRARRLVESRAAQIKDPQRRRRYRKARRIQQVLDL